jgi:hypothetical protein
MPTQPGSRKGIGGPKTPEGKQRVSLNALTHGLTAESDQARQVIAEAVGVDYDTILLDMMDYYRPADPIERILVRRIARSTWRLLITEASEDRVFARRGLRSTPGTSQERILLVERRIDIQFHRAIAALAEKRLREQNNSQNKLPGCDF